MSGKIYKRHFEGSIKSDQIVATLQHVQRHQPGKIVLIWDRARTHKSKKTQAYLALHPEIYQEELPPYAPELNPEEYCHGNIKHHLKNARPFDKREMRLMLNGGFARLRHRPDLLLSFFHAAGLVVKQLQLI
jgi:transposase